VDNSSSPSAATAGATFAAALVLLAIRQREEVDGSALRVGAAATVTCNAVVLFAVEACWVSDGRRELLLRH